MSRLLSSKLLEIFICSLFNSRFKCCARSLRCRLLDHSILSGHCVFLDMGCLLCDLLSIYGSIFSQRIMPRQDLFTTVKKIVSGQVVYGPIMNTIFFSYNAVLQGCINLMLYITTNMLNVQVHFLYLTFFFPILCSTSCPCIQLGYFRNSVDIPCSS